MRAGLRGFLCLQGAFRPVRNGRSDFHEFLLRILHVHITTSKMSPHTSQSVEFGPFGPKVSSLTSPV